MKLKFSFTILFMLLITSSVFAQKYSSNDGIVVEQKYNGVTFSSELTLGENLTQLPNFEKELDVLSKFEDKIFTEGVMGTVFITEDVSFEDLSEDELESLFVNKSKLENFFKFYIIPGRLDSNSLKKAIEKNGGSARLKTLHGDNLGVKLVNNQLVIFDSENNSATITASDFFFNKGLFHIVNGLVYPQ